MLRTPAEPVRDFDAELRRLVKDLTETMLDAPGAGLAATSIAGGDASSLTAQGKALTFTEFLTVPGYDTITTFTATTPNTRAKEPAR